MGAGPRQDAPTVLYRDRILALLKDGLGPTEVAQRLGVTKGVVHGVRHRAVKAGLMPARVVADVSYPAVVHREAILALARQGLMPSQIARRLAVPGLGSEQCRRQMARAGIRVTATVTSDRRNRPQPKKTLPPPAPAAIPQPEASPAATTHVAPSAPAAASGLPPSPPIVLLVGKCKYPTWGDGRPTHVYCDAPTIPGKVYCPKCAARCWVSREDRVASPARAR